MAILRIPAQNRKIEGTAPIRKYLGKCGIRYDTWTPFQPVANEASAEEILGTYANEIEALKARGGYVTADVIDVHPGTPGLEEMLAKFNREHWHDEDEVRFIIAGRGLFHIRPADGPVVALQVEPGDLICVPKETRHWFDLCADRHIRAVRLFQDLAGWTPHYTDSGIDRNFQPVCLGLSDIPPSGPSERR